MSILYTHTGAIGSQNESIFHYRPYETFDEFFDSTFPAAYVPSFMDQALEMQAYSICDDDPFCIFDIAVTSNLELGLSTHMVGESIEILDDLAVPGKRYNTEDLYLQL